MAWSAAKSASDRSLSAEDVSRTRALVSFSTGLPAQGVAIPGHSRRKGQIDPPLSTTIVTLDTPANLDDLRPK
jgi:hypothetical protein